MRGKRKSRKDDEDESAYSEDESVVEAGSSDESYSSVASEEYESDEEYDDDEDDRPRRVRPVVHSSYNRYPMHPSQYPQQHPTQHTQGSFYQQWINMPRPPMAGGPVLMPRPPQMMMQGPMMMGQRPPMMMMPGQRPPMMGPQFANPPVNGARPPQGAFTAEQLADIAKTTIASLVGGPKASEPSNGGANEANSGEEVKAVVSDELKNSITSMLVDPELRIKLFQRLYANQMAKAQASGQPIAMPPPHMMAMMRPPMGQPRMYPQMAPMMPRTRAPKVKKYRAPMRYDDGSDAEEAGGRGRRRSAARKVNFNKFYQEEEEVEKTLEELEQNDMTRTVGDRGAVGMEFKEKSNRGRKKKIVDEEEEEVFGAEDEFGIQPIAKKRGSGRKSKQASDDDDDDVVAAETGHNDDVVVGGEESDDDGPSVNKILSHRLNKKGQDEFLVKFHGLSYLHLEWISKEEMLEAKMGGSRIKKFMSKPLSAHHYDEKHPFNPDYTRIDRIVSGWEHPEVDNPDVMTASYLVKWKSLPYEEASWEKKSDVVGIDGGSEKIAEWLARPALETRQDKNELKIGQRPLKSSWQAMPESPVYKNGNILRSYQLEGINWLVYCWINKQSCIIADEMGLGKTVQSVSFLQLLQTKFKVKGPFLVVAPLSTIPHWEREFQAWTGNVYIVGMLLNLV